MTEGHKREECTLHSLPNNVTVRRLRVHGQDHMSERASARALAASAFLNGLSVRLGNPKERKAKQNVFSFFNNGILRGACQRAVKRRIDFLQGILREDCGLFWKGENSQSAYPCHGLHIWPVVERVLYNT